MIKVGEKFNNFLIKAEIGRGGMGTIYYAIDTMLNREVALKIIHPQLADNTQLMERFKIEAMTQARMNHPNIVMIFSFTKLENDYVIVMEFIAGKSLKEILHEKQHLPLDEAIHYVEHILVGLQYAHIQNVIHRDIKPANILITTEHNVKLSDFGIAKVLGSQSLTKTGMLVGTPWYTSPEQILNRNVDFRADLYSLGVTFYEMLTGRVPFDSETNSEFQIQKAHLETPPPRPSIYNPEIGMKLERFILKALQKKVEKRFQSASEMLAELKRMKVEMTVITQRPVEIKGEVEEVEAAKPIPRPKSSFTPVKIVGLMIAVLLSVLLIVIFSGVFSKSEPTSGGGALIGGGESGIQTGTTTDQPSTSIPPATEGGRTGTTSGPQNLTTQTQEQSTGYSGQTATGQKPGQTTSQTMPGSGQPGDIKEKTEVTVETNAAEKSAEELTARDPSGINFSRLGHIKMSLNKFPEAEKCWAKALQSNASVNIPVWHQHPGGGECSGIMMLRVGMIIFNSKNNPEHSFRLKSSDIEKVSRQGDGVNIKAAVEGNDYSGSFAMVEKNRRKEKERFVVEFVNKHVVTRGG